MSNSPAARPQMSRRRATLDRNRPYGIVYGAGPVRFEQDHKKFDHKGFEILPDGGNDHTADDQFGGETPHASERPRSPAAERMRRTRQRRRAGIVAVVNIEITKEDIAQFVARNLLMPKEIGDQQQVASAVRRALDSWIGSPRRKTP